ncbi:hypothetical protein ACRV9H_004663 [Escherichia albertii]
MLSKNGKIISRIESDFLGEREVSDDCYYGVQTLRGEDNFHITEMPMSQELFFIIAFGYVKKAAAMANKELMSRMVQKWFFRNLGGRKWMKLSGEQGSKLF